MYNILVLTLTPLGTTPHVGNHASPTDRVWEYYQTSSGFLTPSLFLTGPTKVRRRKHTQLSLMLVT